MTTAVVVLSLEGLVLARRLRAARPEATSIFGPSCIVGVCGGPGPAPAADGLPPGTFATAERGVFGWTGPLRRVFPALWDRFDAIVAVMALGIVVRLAGPLATDKRRDPAVVVVDDAGRYAISVLGGHGAGADNLAHLVASILGAAAIVTTTGRGPHIPAAAHHAMYDGGEGGPNPGA